MSRSGHQREYHIVVLGSGGVGKSCLTAQFVQNVWIERYDPTIEDSYRKQIEVDGRQVVLEILDTAGTEQFTAMREIYMKSGQGFLLVFSITNLASLNELHELREQLVNLKDDPQVPIVLVGNKSDLEEDRQVSRARAFAVSQQWGNTPYYETSARRRANVNEVFIDVCRQIIRRDMAHASARPSPRDPGRHRFDPYHQGHPSPSSFSSVAAGRRRRHSDPLDGLADDDRGQRRRRRRRRHHQCTIL